MTTTQQPQHTPQTYKDGNRYWIKCFRGPRYGGPTLTSADRVHRAHCTTCPPTIVLPGE